MPLHVVTLGPQRWKKRRKQTKRCVFTSGQQRGGAFLLLAVLPRRHRVFGSARPRSPASFLKSGSSGRSHVDRGVPSSAAHRTERGNEGTECAQPCAMADTSAVLLGRRSTKVSGTLRLLGYGARHDSR
ncbi:hypothetical protein NDU88_005134 [Pleurodeles waltl]|uniref:Uncharacterized protein n=1 Tax=Pleurodeles waltl TaxID=8319 RepID=A0AAV7LN97_PLEWA|nr:hypothetical protein NDU88_005134 [Pleurodeles waltl]